MKNRTCPKCREVGRDSKGDHLWLMSDGVTWACFKDCHLPYFEREGGKQVSNSVNQFTILDITNLPIIENKERGISLATMNRFRVRTEFSEQNGSPVAVYYPETYGGSLGSYKKRLLPKSFSVIKKEGLGKELPDFFGEFTCPKAGKRLLLCAGEEDTLAAYEILNKKYPEWDHAIVGLPRGEESSINVVAEKKDFLNNFDEVIICTDMDDAGRRALAKLIPIIGERSRTIQFSEKDISDMHTKNKHKEFISAYFSAKEYRPSSIVSVEDILEEAIKPREWGLSYPFPTLTQLTYGMKNVGEVIGLGAAPGKTLPL